ncbi:MAG: hypothetical protein ACFFE8_12700 [Candidatus Heimdallarchaeota archaeon]
MIQFAIDIKWRESIGIFILIILAFSFRIPFNSSLLSENSSLSRSTRISSSFMGEKPSLKIHQQGGQDFGSLINTARFSHSVRCLEFSPSGKFFAAGGSAHLRTSSGSISLYNFLQGILLWSNLAVHLSQTESLAFSPDERILATVGRLGGMKLWNVSDGTQISVFPDAENRSFEHLLFSRDGTEIIASTRVEGIRGQYEQGFLSFWNVSSGEMKSEVELPYGASRDIALSPNGSLLATGSNEHASEGQKVSVWDLSTPELELVHTFSAQGTETVRTLDFSPDGTLVALGVWDGNVRIWNLTSGTEIIESPLSHDLSTGILVSVKFSPQGTTLVSAAGDDVVGTREIKFWDTTTWENFHTIILERDAPFLAFTPSGDILAVGSYEQGVDFRKAARSQVQFQRLIHHTSPVTSLAFGSNGLILVSTDSNSNIQFWNVSNQQTLVNFTGSPPTVLGTSVALSAGRQWLVSGSSDNIIRFWNISNGQLQYSLTGHETSVLSVAFSPNGQWLASGDDKGMIKLWNVTNPTNFTVHFNLTGHFSAVTSIQFSPDSRLLASGSAQSSILVWNLTTGKTIASLLGHKNRITSMVFAPDGKSLVSASWDGTAKIWDIPGATLSEVELLHPGPVNALEYSRDGNLIASAGSDGVVRLWEATSGNLLSSLRDQTREIFSLAFSFDTTQLAAAGGDLDVFLYDLDPLPLDTDGDGMSNPWETTYGLDPLDFWDAFADPDGDGLMNNIEHWLLTNPNSADSDNDSIPDLWEHLYHSDPTTNDGNQDVDQDGLSNLYEYQMGLNSFINDSRMDLDGDGLTNLIEQDFGSWANQTDSDFDGMPDWYEYQAGGVWIGDNFYPRLNPLQNDSQEDLDRDGMPNLYEYLHEFKAWVSDDALIDSDNDGINNLAEYRAGTNPRDFWSVPLVSGSIPHLLFIIVIIIFIIGNLAYFQGRPLLQRRYLRKFDAPDYPTAKRVQQANLPNYAALLQAQEEVAKILTAAASFYYQGESLLATEKFIQASEASQHLGYLRGMVEADLRVVLIAKESGTLAADHAVFQRIPPIPSDDPYTAALTHMLLAVREEVNDNWGAAEHFWHDALLSDQLRHDFRTACQAALVESAFRTWFYDQSNKNHNRILKRLEEWQLLSEASNRPGSLCPVFLFQARFALAQYDFKEVDKWLQECMELAETTGVTHYLKQAEKAKEELVHHKERIETLIAAERLLSPEEQGKLVQQYVRRAILIKEDYTSQKP